MESIMTILYNTEIKKPISGFLNPYYMVDGQRPILGQDIIELDVEYVSLPEYNIEYQRIQTEWVIDTLNKKYIQRHNIIDKSQYEILIEDWKYLKYSNRIRIPVEILQIEAEINTLSVLFLIKDKPSKFSESSNLFYLYDNIFDQFTQNIIEKFKLEVEYIPTEKTY